MRRVGYTQRVLAVGTPPRLCSSDHKWGARLCLGDGTKVLCRWALPGVSSQAGGKSGCVYLAGSLGIASWWLPLVYGSHGGFFGSNRGPCWWYRMHGAREFVTTR